MDFPVLERRLAAPPRAGARAARHELNVALCVPLGGTIGIWGPSALASAKLAAAELNAGNGIGGRSCRLLVVNASDDSPDIEATLRRLVDRGEVDALVGMHTSAVRQRIVRAVGGRLPFVYTPVYEGGESTPGVHAIGETPGRQLRPAVEWLSRHERVRRWVLVGNDYVWPHVSHALAKRYVHANGGEVVADHYLPFGGGDHERVLDDIRNLGADAVMISLVGEDAVEFNRAFGRCGLQRSVLRLSCVIEENELLGIGADNTERLYVAAGYFGALETDANLAFKERYFHHFGERSPTLNSLGQSTYEGLHYLAALMDPQRAEGAPLAHRSARHAAYDGEGVCAAPVYLARAEGHVFRVIRKL